MPTCVVTYGLSFHLWNHSSNEAFLRFTSMRRPRANQPCTYMRDKREKFFSSLTTYIIEWSNPRKLLPIWPRKTVRWLSRNNDFCVWRIASSILRVSVNAQTIVRNAPQYLRTYHISHWSSCLDWSKFVYRDEYRNDKKCCFLPVFLKKIHIEHTKLSK